MFQSAHHGFGVRSSRLGRALSLVLAVGAFGVLTLPAGECFAQPVSLNVRMGGSPSAGQVSKRAVERYAEMLGMSSDQKEAAVMMHGGYAAAYAQRQKALRDGMDEIRRTAEDSGDRSVFMEKMPALQRENREALAKLEKDFFADMKSLLSGAAQEEKWASVERARRREVGLRAGQLSGENVDLIEVVAALKLTGEPAQNVATVLEGYEVELDQQLVAKEANKVEGMAFEPGKPIDIEKIQKQMEAERESGLKIVDVNQNNARKIEGLLPDEAREEFKAAYRKACFPRVYRDSRVSKEMEAALRMSDLDAAQREQIEAQREAYVRETGPLNNALANAIEANEKAEGSASGGFAGGGGMVFLSRGEEPEPLKDARKARREADEKAAQKLRGVLRADQKEKLPKTFEGDEPEMVGGAQIMIREER